MGIEEVETETGEIKDLEEIETKIKQEMVIGFAKVVETIILHLEPSVTDVGNQERAMIWVKEKIEEKIIDEQKKDHNEETEIEEIDVIILEPLTSKHQEIQDLLPVFFVSED